MASKRLLTIAVTISIVLAISLSLQNVSFAQGNISFNSNTCWHYVTPNDYLCWASTLYAASDSWVDNSQYSYITFVLGSFSSSLFPSQTFGTGVYGGNATITTISANSVVYSESQSTGDIENLSFYYSGSVPTQVLVNQGSLASISQAQYITSFPTWSASPGNNAYWNSTGGYVEVKTSIPNALVSFIYGQSQIAIYLNHANTGPKLTSPDYILISYISNGNLQTLQGEDGANFINADPGTIVSIAGISGNPTVTQRFCLYQCTAVNIQTSPSGPQNFTLNYYTQFSTQVKDSGLPYPDSFLQTINQLPQFNYSNAGSYTTIGLLSTYQTVWIDNGSTWNTKNPAFIDLHYFLPSPASGTILSSSSLTIAYGTDSSFPSGGSCTSNNLFTLVLNTCLFSVFYYTWFNIFGSFGFGLILMGIDLALYNKTENPLMVTLAMIAEGGVLGAILPQFFLPLSTIFIVVGLTGSLYNVIRER